MLQARVVVSGTDVPLHLAALVGCSGVAVNAIQGARLAGAATNVVDSNPAKLEIARRFGATTVVDASSADAARSVCAATGRGVDVTIDAIGRADPAEPAVKMTRRRGNAVLVGMPGTDAEVRLGMPASVSPVT